MRTALFPNGRTILNEAVVETYSDNSRRVFFDGIPLGRKLQAPGERCRRWNHDWRIDRYPGVRHEYVDKVCTKCHRRKMIK